MDMVLPVWLRHLRVIVRALAPEPHVRCPRVSEAVAGEVYGPEAGDLHWLLRIQLLPVDRLVPGPWLQRPLRGGLRHVRAVRGPQGVDVLLLHSKRELGIAEPGVELEEPIVHHVQLFLGHLSLAHLDLHAAVRRRIQHHGDLQQLLLPVAPRVRVRAVQLRVGAGPEVQQRGGLQAARHRVLEIGPPDGPDGAALPPAVGPDALPQVAKGE
mmetsp:Transcript_8007/g.20937  ORF Transcript_8007/g.20937 Transcript_8007/m.20937 type:complete len:212 (+) Transcript_8007:630-1265(+)